MAGTKQLQTILVVEDQEVLAMHLSMSLERAGFRVLTAYNGLAAVAEVEREGGFVDAIVTDVRMPGMDGLEMLRGLREHAGYGAAVLVSGYPCPVSPHEARQLGVVRFLQKPFFPRQLVAALNEALVSSPGLRAARALE